MRFYYLSVFSLFLLAVIYLVGTGFLLWLGSWLKKKWKHASIVMAPLFLLLYIGPIAEELWIAWNFGRLCNKDAGLSIYKTVEVDGFYDGTMHSGYENTRPGRYRFVEHPTQDRTGIERVERADEALRNQAVQWYAKTNPGKERPKDRSIYFALNEKETIVVFPNGVDAWRVTKLDHPTAKYHFFMDKGRDIGHKLAKQESRVINNQTQETLGEYRVYIREAPWFFVGLDRPNMGCDGPEGGPHSKHKNSFLIYRDVLKPAISENGEKK
jgi:hypothetical protein